VDNRFSRSTKQNRYLGIPIQVIIGLLSLSIMYFFTVSAFGPQSKEYVFVKKWGSEGTGDGQFIDPGHPCNRFRRICLCF
jgi:hypothetical protein